jgi:Tfp pilus assembly protein FimT
MRSTFQPRVGPHAARGITLVETMVVIAVLGLVGVMAGPSFTASFAKNHLRGAAGEAYADMQLARAEAVQSNGVVNVTFSSNGYQVLRGAQVVKAVTYGGGVAVSSGGTMTVSFDPVRATATVANGPHFLTHASASSTLRLSVNTLGRPEVCASSGTLSGYSAC